MHFPSLVEFVAPPIVYFAFMITTAAFSSHKKLGSSSPLRHTSCLLCNNIQLVEIHVLHCSKTAVKRSSQVRQLFLMILDACDKDMNRDYSKPST